MAPGKDKSKALAQKDRENSDEDQEKIQTIAICVGASASLRAIVFLPQARRGKMTPRPNHQDLRRRWLATLIRSAVMAE